MPEFDAASSSSSSLSLSLPLPLPSLPDFPRPLLPPSPLSVSPLSLSLSHSSCPFFLPAASTSACSTIYLTTAAAVSLRSGHSFAVSLPSPLSHVLAGIAAAKLLERKTLSHDLGTLYAVASSFFSCTYRYAVLSNYFAPLSRI